MSQGTAGSYGCTYILIRPTLSQSNSRNQNKGGLMLIDRWNALFAYFGQRLAGMLSWSFWDATCKDSRCREAAVACKQVAGESCANSKQQERDHAIAISVRRL